METANETFLIGKDVWLKRLGELSVNLYYNGHGSEGETALYPFYHEGALDRLTPETFTEALGLNPELASDVIELFRPMTVLLQPERACLIGSIDETMLTHCIETINAIANRQLHSLCYMVLGLDDGSIVEHPLYLIGLTREGHIAGFRSSVIWT
ncbi:MAG TPA: hypothetical protein PKA70_19245 [Saprospiraceae bacterium]|nr:hypothetical protein [Saprospiraceae bacterium]